MDTSNRTSNNFFSGFLIGALFGAAVVFFLGTKKGKELLKIISEKGMDNVSHLLEEAGKATDLDEAYSEEEEIVPKVKLTAVKEVVDEKPKTRRFFRGVSRHLN